MVTFEPQGYPGSPAKPLAPVGPRQALQAIPNLLTSLTQAIECVREDYEALLADHSGWTSCSARTACSASSAMTLVDGRANGQKALCNVIPKVRPDTGGQTEQGISRTSSPRAPTSDLQSTSRQTTPKGPKVPCGDLQRDDTDELYVQTPRQPRILHIIEAEDGAPYIDGRSVDGSVATPPQPSLPAARLVDLDAFSDYNTPTTSCKDQQMSSRVRPIALDGMGVDLTILPPGDIGSPRPTAIAKPCSAGNICSPRSEASWTKQASTSVGGMFSSNVEPMPKRELLDWWKAEAEGSNTIRSKTSGRSSNRIGTRTGDIVRSRSCIQRFVIHPSSKQSMGWDIASIIILTTDLILSPMDVFGLEPSDTMPWFMWLSAVFWTTDVGVKSNTGFYVHGLLEMRPGKVFGRYLKRSLLFDLALICIDWMFIMADVSTAMPKVLRASKGVRVLRLLRMVRLLRVIKMMTVFYSLDAMIRSSFLNALFRVVRSIFCIVVLNHFVACSWFGISKLSVDSYDLVGWSNLLETDRPGYPPSMFYEYSTSLHWALTQFTPASMEIHPRNSFERIFTILVMLMSLLAFSSVVASMTATMTQMMAANSEHVKNVELLKRFIAEHKVSVDLSTRIYGYISREKKRVASRPVLERQVPMLRSLPENLQKDLHAEVFANVLLLHPLFCELEQKDEMGVEQVSHLAMTDNLFILGTQVWENEEAAKRMFFVLRGDLHLFPAGSDTTRWLSRKNLEAHATRQDILSEQALWLKTAYAGDLYAITDVEAFTLDSVAFAKVMQRGPLVRFLFAYARIYRDYLFRSKQLFTVDLEQAANIVHEAFVESDVNEPPVPRQESWHSTITAYSVEWFYASVVKTLSETKKEAVKTMRTTGVFK